MEQDFPPYQHSPIPRDSDEFRLIRLVDPATVLIFHARLNEGPGFRALSYTWYVGLYIDIFMAPPTMNSV